MSTIYAVVVGTEEGKRKRKYEVFVRAENVVTAVREGEKIIDELVGLHERITTSSGKESR